MSSFAYGVATAGRIDTKDGEADTPAKKAAKSVVDALAAIVPAEALLVYTGLLVPAATKTAPGQYDGKIVTTVIDPGLFKWGIPALAALSAFLYVVGRLKAKKFDSWDYLRLLIPALAMICWSALQTPSGLEAVFTKVSAGSSRVGAGILGVTLAAAAAALGFKADQA